DLAACVPEIAEPARVEALVAETPVEAFDESILNRFAWIDVIQFDSMIDSPGKEVAAGQFAAVIHADSFRPAAIGDHAIEGARHAAAWQGSIDFKGQALAGKRVDNRQHTHASAIRHSVVDEVHRP